MLKPEHIKHQAELLERLGPEPCQKLARISLTLFPETTLREQIDFRLRLLLADADVDAVRRLLFECFARGIQERRTVFIVELLRQIKEGGIQVRAPELVKVDSLGEPAASCLFLLQWCESPLPMRVISDVCGVTESVLTALVDPHIRAGNLVVHGTNWLIGPLLTRRLGHANAPASRARVIYDTRIHSGEQHE